MSDKNDPQMKFNLNQHKINEAVINFMESSSKQFNNFTKLMETMTIKVNQAVELLNKLEKRIEELENSNNDGEI